MRSKLKNELTAKLVARLAMRWPQAAAYVPTGSTTVHTPNQLDDEIRALFDCYVLGYQDAIDDVVRLLQGGDSEPAPYALQVAENSPFQGGTLPPLRNRQFVRDSGHKRSPKKSDARQRAEELFSGGDHEP